MKNYVHTQRGKILIALFMPVILLLPCLWMLARSTRSGGAAVVMTEIILVVMLLLFHTLTVSIDENHLLVKFGIGLIRFRFELAAITAAAPVRNSWYHGWGIRLLDKGWLYNVSGLDAVEITLMSGAVHRIGTDEPEALVLAIDTARRRSGGTP